MNKILIGVASGLGGALIGSGVTFFFTKKYYDKEIEGYGNELYLAEKKRKEAEKTLATYMLSGTNPKTGEDYKVVDNSLDNPEMDIPDSKVFTDSSYTDSWEDEVDAEYTEEEIQAIKDEAALDDEYEDEQTITDPIIEDPSYDANEEPYDEEEEELNHEMDIENEWATDEEIMNNVSDDICMITRSDWDFVGPQYRKVDLVYFEEDDVLVVRGNDRPISSDERYEMLGDDFENMYDPEVSPDDVFLTNDRTGCAYHVVCRNEAYMDVIKGLIR